MAYCNCGGAKTVTADDAGGATTISVLHPDIIQTHILTRLDGPTLSSAAATSSQLRALSAHEHLWTNICHSTWPSINTPRILHVISTFPRASRSFFSDSFSAPTAAAAAAAPNSHDPTPLIISAVDLFHRGKQILSRVVETETETGWFRCSPFRVDLLDPKDVIQTAVEYPKGEEACQDLGEELTLSWIVIDSRGRRAVNLSSRKPVSVKRHWLSGEVQVRFASVLGGGERGSASEMALCSLVVTWGGVEGGGGMQVREVSMQMEDMDGTHLNGKESLVILQKALEGKRGRLVEEEGRKRFSEFVKRKEERKEEKVRAERRLDVLCVALAALSFAVLFCLLRFWN